MNYFVLLVANVADLIFISSPVCYGVTLRQASFLKMQIRRCRFLGPVLYSYLSVDLMAD